MNTHPPGVVRVGGIVVVHHAAALQALLDAVKIATRARRFSGLPTSRAYAELVCALSEALTDSGHTDVRKPPELAEFPLQPLSITEAAKTLGLSNRQTRRLAPRLGGHRSGGRWLLDREAVIEHLEGRKQS